MQIDEVTGGKLRSKTAQLQETEQAVLNELERVPRVVIAICNEEVEASDPLRVGDADRRSDRQQAPLEYRSSK